MQNSASRRIVGGPLGLAVLIGIGVWLVSSRSSAPLQGGDVHAPSVADATTASGASAPADTADAPATKAAPTIQPTIARAVPSPPPVAATTIATDPLPPPNTPLAQVIDELERRARAGDAAASCRLGFELLRCRHSAQASAQRDMMADVLARTTRSGTAASASGTGQVEVEKMLVDLAARNALFAEQAQAVCADVDPQRYDTPLRLLMRAANSGDATSRAALMRSVDAINQGNTLANLDALAAFRAAAPGWVADELNTGSDLALDLAVQLGMQTNPGLLQQSLVDRPPLAYAMMQLHDRAPGASQRVGAAAARASVLSLLPPADSAVQADAAAMVARFDAARAARGVPIAPGSVSMPTLGQQLVFDPGADAAACGRDLAAPPPRTSG